MRRRFWTTCLITLINCVVLGLLVFAFLVHRPVNSWQIPLYSSPYRFYGQDKLLVTWNYSHGKQLQVWDTETKEKLADLKDVQTTTGPQVTISADGSSMAWLQKKDGAFQLIYMKFREHQQIVLLMPPGSEGLNCNPLLNHNGTKLAFHDVYQKRVQLWDTTTNQLVATLGGFHFTMISSPDGKRLLTWSSAGNVPDDSRLWDFESGKLLLNLEPTPLGYTVQRDFSQDNQSIYGLQYRYQGQGWNDIVKIKWNLVDGHKTELWQKTLADKWRHCDQGQSASMFMLYESEESSTIQLFDSVTAEFKGSFDEHLLDETPQGQPRGMLTGGPCRRGLVGISNDGRLALSPDQRYLVIAYEFRDQTRAWWRKQLSHVMLSRLVPPDTGIRVRVIDLVTTQPEFIYDLTPGHVNSAHRVAFASSSNLLAVAKDHGNNNTIEIWNVPRRLQWGYFVLSTMLFGLLWLALYRIKLRRPLLASPNNSKSTTPIK